MGWLRRSWFLGDFKAWCPYGLGSYKKKVYWLPLFSPRPPPHYWYIFFPLFCIVCFLNLTPGFHVFFLLPPPYSPLFILDLCFSFLFGPTRLNLDANAAYGCVSVVHMGRFWTSYADVSVSLAFISPFCYFPSTRFLISSCFAHLRHSRFVFFFLSFLFEFSSPFWTR